MNAFANNVSLSGINSGNALTNNGALTNETSTSALVDYFFLAGASRTMSENDITSAFARAYGEDNEIALRLLLWTRDAREGAGERETFRRILRWLDRAAPEALLRVLPRVPELGRWDDLLVVESKEARKFAVEMFRAAYASGNGLASKWSPRSGYEAKKLRDDLGMSPKQYRKLIVGLTNVVESQMCSNSWKEIELQKVPSVASARYRKAFQRHLPEAFSDYASKLVKGEAKINASAIFPHDVIKPIKGYSDADQIMIANAQWDALPDFVEEGSFIPVVDVSGSMALRVSGTTTAMDISSSLGIYLSERNKGAFKDIVVTFAENPTIQKLSGNLKQRIDQTLKLHWGGNTNLQRAFEAILSHAKTHRVPKEDMPQTLIIASDMEFDFACRGETNFHAIKAQYENSGYDLPKIVFWNVCGRVGNVPVTTKDSNTSLVSGFSPSIIRSVLGKGTNPFETMMETIGKERYALAE